MEQKKSTKYILIAISVLFIFVMLILPLFSILFSALKEGFAFYIQAVTTEYVRSALLVTLLATVIAVIVNTFFGSMASDKVFLPWETGACHADRYPVFNLSRHCRSCLFDDLRTTRLDVSGNPGDQPVFRNKHPHYVCVTGCGACHNFCHFPVCIA